MQLLFLNEAMGFIKHVSFSITAILLTNCVGVVEETDPITSPYEVEVPSHFPPIPVSNDNPLSEEKIALGKRLFFDPILSLDSSVRCASCHFTSHAFSDTITLSRGIGDSIGDRNAPSLMNVAYATSLFRDGGAPSLEMQLYTPIEDEKEMHLDIDQAVIRLLNNTSYVRDFQNVFDTLPTLFGLTRSIAAYERTLISGNSTYDHFLKTGDSSIFNPQEKLGLQLFMSDELQCYSCHSGFYMSDNSYRNNGLYATYDDLGRANLSLDTSDIGKFKVPSLRNISITGPYMHNGSVLSLGAIIDHYAEGGKNNANQDDLINGFQITEEEKEALIQFLETLTDSAYLSVAL